MNILTALTALTALTLPTALTAQKATPMPALGTFDVKVIPQPPDDSAAGPFGRLFLDKQFHGDLEGTSRGQMLGSMNEKVQGSGGYVALELVTGTLNGRKGSFILQHNGTMQRGNSTMNVVVVPDSGTEELTGIAGRMTITIDGPRHSYAFDYTLTPER
jgi:hypothetical protein